MCPLQGRWRRIVRNMVQAEALARQVRINRIFATGLRAAPQFDVGLRRRNNELTNFRAAWAAGIAPERGSYSRIGACPYLPPQLINSRCCPCKGRISWAGLAPQQDSRYEPLTGARFINRIQKVGASPYPGICAPFRGAGAALSEIWFRQRRWRRIVLLRGHQFHTYFSSISILYRWHSRRNSSLNVTVLWCSSCLSI